MQEAENLQPNNRSIIARTIVPDTSTIKSAKIHSLLLYKEQGWEAKTLPQPRMVLAVAIVVLALQIPLVPTDIPNRFLHVGVPSGDKIVNIT